MACDLLLICFFVGMLGRKGVIAPMTKDIYEPMLVKLEKEGIRFVENVYKV